MYRKFVITLCALMILSQEAAQAQRLQLRSARSNGAAGAQVQAPTNENDTDAQKRAQDAFIATETLLAQKAMERLKENYSVDPEIEAKLIEGMIGNADIQSAINAIARDKTQDLKDINMIRLNLIARMGALQPSNADQIDMARRDGVAAAALEAATLVFTAKPGVLKETGRANFSAFLKHLDEAIRAGSEYDKALEFAQRMFADSHGYQIPINQFVEAARDTINGGVISAFKGMDDAARYEVTTKSGQKLEVIMTGIQANAMEGEVGDMLARLIETATNPESIENAIETSTKGIETAAAEAEKFYRNNALLDQKSETTKELNTKATKSAKDVKELLRVVKAANRNIPGRGLLDRIRDVTLVGKVITTAEKHYKSQAQEIETLSKEIQQNAEGMRKTAQALLDMRRTSNAARRELDLEIARLVMVADGLEQYAQHKEANGEPTIAKAIRESIMYIVERRKNDALATSAFLTLADRAISDNIMQCQDSIAGSERALRTVLPMIGVNAALKTSNRNLRASTSMHNALDRFWEQQVDEMGKTMVENGKLINERIMKPGFDIKVLETLEQRVDQTETERSAALAKGAINLEEASRGLIALHNRTRHEKGTSAVYLNAHEVVNGATGGPGAACATSTIKKVK